LLLETGGVRLQEANLGLAAIAEIQAAMWHLDNINLWSQSLLGVLAVSVECRLQQRYAVI
jgi:malonate decarboxylase beta subunit